MSRDVSAKYTSKSSLPLPSVPMPSINCPVCDQYDWHVRLLSKSSQPGRTCWECGTCHPEVVLSGGLEYKEIDVAKLRREIADMVRAKGENRNG